MSTPRLAMNAVRPSRGASRPAEPVRFERAARRAIALLAAALAFAGPALAAKPAAPASGAAACPPEPAPVSAAEFDAGLRDAHDAGFLWKATRDGHATYLYGTIHIAQRAWMFPGPSVAAAIGASDAVALELDPTDPGIVARLQRAIAADADAPELPAALAARLRAQLAAACLEPSVLAGLRPEMRAVTVEVMAGRRLGLYPAYGIDLVVAQLAHRLGKPLRSLETPESQAALLVSDDPAETARSVGQVMDELDGGDATRILGRLADDWHRGDLADLGAYGDWCGCLKTPEERADFARLIDARNPLMADRIARWHAEGRSLFVAVGSLHMVGRDGLPELLRARGFSVERLASGAAR